MENTIKMLKELLKRLRHRKSPYYADNVKLTLKISKDSILWSSKRFLCVYCYSQNISNGSKQESFKWSLTKHSHRVLTMSQCEWILYESGHSFLMKASRILYPTVPDSLQCSCCCLKRTKNDLYRNI